MSTQQKIKLVPAIVEARKAKGWTQERLAQEMGVSQPTVALMESGYREPKASLIEKAMEALGLTVTQMSRCERDTNDPRP